MATRNQQQTRLAVYGTIVAILIICSVVFFQFLREAENASKTLSEAINAEKQDYEKLDTTVLQSQKFKDLKAVVVPAAPDKPKEEDVLSDDYLAKLPRKKSNPFIPSF